MRLSTFAVFALLIALGCGVYNVANDYERTERKLNAVNKKIGAEEEAMRVLQAEWTFLTSPDRLEKISAEYLHLQAVDGRQYVALASIPMRDTLDAQEAAQQIASASAQPVQKEIVKQVAPQQAPVAVANAAAVEAKIAADQAEFNKIIAKELAPVSSVLPPAAKSSLPELQATPVSMTEGVQ